MASAESVSRYYFLGGALLIACFIALIIWINKSQILYRNRGARYFFSILVGLIVTACSFGMMYLISEGEIFPPKGEGVLLVFNWVILLITLLLPMTLALITAHQEDGTVLQIMFRPWLALIACFLLMVLWGIVGFFITRPYSIAIIIAAIIVSISTPTVVIILIGIRK